MTTVNYRKNILPGKALCVQAARAPDFTVTIRKLSNPITVCLPSARGKREGGARAVDVETMHCSRQQATEGQPLKHKETIIITMIVTFRKLNKCQQ